MPSAKGTAKYTPAGVSLWGLPLASATQGSRVAYSALNESCALRCLPPPVRSLFGLGNASAGSVDHDDRSAGGAAAHALSVDYDRDGKPRNFSVSCEETASFHIRGGVSVLLTGGKHSTAGISAALESLAAFSLVVPVVVRLGAPFKEVRRNVLFADLRGRLGGVASWASTHGMNLPSHKDEVAADFALAGILACTRMQREWLLPMLETGALGVPGSFDSIKGGKAKLGTGEKPPLTFSIITSAALKLSSLSDAAFRLLPVEQRKFWRDAARDAAASVSAGEDESGGEEVEEVKGRQALRQIFGQILSLSQ